MIRLEKGDMLIDSIIELARNESITGGYFSGVGAVKNITIGFRNDQTNRYEFSEIHETCELASLQGTLGEKDGKPIPHLHAVLAHWGGMVSAGHIKNAEIAITAEIFLNLTPGVNMARTYDPETQLDLININ